MKVAIIHLSDFHIKDREHFERAKFNGIVSSLNALGRLDEYLVVFSGDLANSGGINEYRQSRFLFGQLIGGIKQKNNDKFGYPRFDFLYLEDTISKEERERLTIEAINNFFND